MNFRGWDKDEVSVKVADMVVDRVSKLGLLPP
jgi:hypothetical protein